MNTSYQINNNSFFGSQSMFFGNGLKSTEQKLERQTERDNQIAFFEKQKENLKGMKCDSVEEIMEKLKMFHSYEEQIKAAKQQYNDQQMGHVLDEMLERAEKIAEAAEKTKPKTEEERKEDLIEEAKEETLGTEESDEAREEMTEEIEEIAKELDETVEISEEELTEAVKEKVAEEKAEAEALAEKAKAASTEKETERIKIQEKMSYQRIDVLI